MQRLVLLFILLVFTHCKPEPVKFNVTVQSAPAEGGSVTPPSNMYESDDPASFTATPNQGYVFLHWSGDLSGTNNPAILTIDAEKTITAHFELIPVDTEAPTLVVSPSEQTIQLGGTYIVPTVQASDQTDGDLTQSITQSGESEVNTSTVGSYVIVYRVEDAAGNVASASHTIEVITDPNGDDDGDGVINSLDQCGGTVQGTVVDSQGCADTQAPTLTVSPTEQRVALGGQVVTPTLTISDNVATLTVSDVVVEGFEQVDTSAAATYVIVYSVTDTASNTASTTHTIRVIDNANADDDGDGVSNLLDQCPNTVGPEDPEGDSDRDGVLNKNDICKFTSPVVGEEEVNQWGCKTPLYKEVTTDGKVTIKSKAWGVVGTFYRLDETEQEYQLVDNATLRSLVNSNGDYTHVCTSRVTSTASLFAGNYATFTQFAITRGITTWDVSSVTNMSEMFLFSNMNKDITHWDFSNVTDMSRMFEDAFYFNQDITHWNVSNVTDMSYMFDDADDFVQEIGVWNVSNVTTMEGMFKDTSLFNQAIGNWDVSSVTNMSEMFRTTHRFNQPIGNWNTSNVRTMEGMFQSGRAFNQEIENWDVSKVTTMQRMFSGYDLPFNRSLNNWNVSSVTNMSEMFTLNGSFNSSIANWDVSSVTDMSYMFTSATAFNGEIGNWNVESVTIMNGMFVRCSAFNQDLSNWNVRNVTDMGSMFAVTKIFNKDIGGWNVSSVTNMSHMFAAAEAFNQNLSSWDVDQVTDHTNFAASSNVNWLAEHKPQFQ